MSRSRPLMLATVPVALLLPVLLLAVPGASPATAVPPGPADLAATVRDQVATRAATSGPGLAVAVLHDGVVVQTAASGEDGTGAPLRTDTPMRVESLSKSFTATAVMQLVEAGQVELDAPVQDPLPEFRPADPRAARITVRQLLTHTSGMDDAHAPDLYDPDVTTLQQAVAALSTAELASAPGTVFAYHNPNYHVLARLVEVVSGQPFADYLEEHVFEPAGMHDTVDLAMSTMRTPGMAVGHLTAFAHPFRAEGPRYFVDGSGGVVSTAEDLGRWLGVQADGGRTADGGQLLSAAGVAEMHRPQGPPGSDYGFGWYHAESAEGPPLRTSHTGAGAGFSAYQALFTGSGWGVAVLVNHGAGLTAADPAVLGQNLLAELDPTIPPLQERRPGPLVDLVLAALTAATLGWACWALLRSRRWGLRRRRRPWSVPLLLLPQLAAVALALGVPRLQLSATGRTAGWGVLFCVEPVLVVLLVCLGTTAGAVLVARVLGVGRAATRPGTGPASRGRPATRDRQEGPRCGGRLRRRCARRPAGRPRRR